MVTIASEGEYIEDVIKFPFISMKPALNMNMLFKHLVLYLLIRYFKICRLFSDRFIKAAVFHCWCKTFPLSRVFSLF